MCTMTDVLKPECMLSETYNEESEWDYKEHVKLNNIIVLFICFGYSKQLILNKS